MTYGSLLSTALIKSKLLSTALLSPFVLDSAILSHPLSYQSHLIILAH